jgi:probable HAF family extracellular repeat protein
MVVVAGLDRCHGVSGDGSIAIGADGLSAAYWSAENGIVGLPLLDPGSFGYGEAQAASWDGTTIVGYDTSPGYVAPWRWTADTGVMSLGTLAGGSEAGVAYGVSSDGSVIVGWSNSNIGNEAFRWTQEAGMVGLGVLAGPGGGSTAWGISADGSTIIGQSKYQAFVWTQEEGMVGLGILGDFEPSMQTQTMPVDVSGDGSVVVGNSWVVGGFIWDATNGTRLLSDALVADYGLDLGGWRLDGVSAISDDGRILVGGGRNPQGQNEIWMVTVPEPGTLVLLAAGVVWI